VMPARIQGGYGGAALVQDSSGTAGRTAGGRVQLVVDRRFHRLHASHACWATDVRWPAAQRLDSQRRTAEQGQPQRFTQ
jgi:hypothetical protein